MDLDGIVKLKDVIVVEVDGDGDELLVTLKINLGIDKARAKKFLFDSILASKFSSIFGGGKD